MPFDWTQYLMLAEELAQRTDEAALRSAISRAYYAVYCSAVAVLRREGVALPGLGVHQLVWSSYQTDPRRQRVNIGNVGNRLRVFRTRADYEATFVRLPETTIEALELARRALRQIRMLEAE